MFIIIWYVLYYLCYVLYVILGFRCGSCWLYKLLFCSLFVNVDGMGVVFIVVEGLNLFEIGVLVVVLVFGVYVCVVWFVRWFLVLVVDLEGVWVLVVVVCFLVDVNFVVLGVFVVLWVLFGRWNLRLYKLEKKLRS